MQTDCSLGLYGRRAVPERSSSCINLCPINPCQASISVVPKSGSNFLFRCYRNPYPGAAANTRTLSGVSSRSALPCAFGEMVIGVDCPPRQLWDSLKAMLLLSGAGDDNISTHPGNFEKSHRLYCVFLMVPILTSSYRICHESPVRINAYTEYLYAPETRWRTDRRRAGFVVRALPAPGDRRVAADHASIRTV